MLRVTLYSFLCCLTSALSLSSSSCLAARDCWYIAKLCMQDADLHHASNHNELAPNNTNDKIHLPVPDVTAMPRSEASSGTTLARTSALLHHYGTGVTIVLCSARSVCAETCICGLSDGGVALCKLPLLLVQESLLASGLLLQQTVLLLQVCHCGSCLLLPGSLAFLLLCQQVLDGLGVLVLEQQVHST